MQKSALVVVCLLVVLPLLAQAGNIGKGRQYKHKEVSHKEKHTSKHKTDSKHSGEEDEIVIKLKEKPNSDVEVKDGDDLVHLSDKDKEDLEEMMEDAEHPTKVEMPDGEVKNVKLKHAEVDQEKEFEKFQKREYERFEKHKFFQYQLAKFQEAQRQLERKLQIERENFEREHGMKMNHERNRHSSWLKRILKKNLHMKGPLKFDPNKEVQEVDVEEKEHERDL